MKRHIVAILAFLFSMRSLSSEGIQLFVSDSGGLAYGEIAKDDKKKYEYILSVESSPNAEKKILLKENAEAKRWETDYWPNGKKKEERVYEKGNLAEKTNMPSSGFVEKTEYYSNGRLESSMEYGYAKNRLIKTITKGPEGNLLWTDIYVYAGNGSLRETRRTYPDGNESNSAYLLSGSRLRSEWIGTQSKGAYVLFDEAGRMVRKEEWEKDNLLSWEQFLYSDEKGKAPQSSVFFDEKKKMRTMKAYDSSGRLTSEKTYSGEASVDIILYDYEGSTLSKKTRTVKGRLEIWKYTYDSTGATRSEEFYKDGKIERIAAFESKDAYSEELYRNGSLFAKNFFVDTVKVREEIYGNGKLVRSRSLK